MGEITKKTTEETTKLICDKYKTKTIDWLNILIPKDLWNLWEVIIIPKLLILKCLNCKNKKDCIDKKDFLRFLSKNKPLEKNNDDWYWN